MKDYKQWTSAERLKSYKVTKKLIELGVIGPALRCSRCGQTEGIIEYHNQDYSDPIAFCKEYCYRCHRMLHKLENGDKSAEKYFQKVDQGVTFPPVFSYKSNF